MINLINMTKDKVYYFKNDKIYNNSIFEVKKILLKNNNFSYELKQITKYNEIFIEYCNTKKDIEELQKFLNILEIFEKR